MNLLQYGKRLVPIYSIFSTYFIHSNYSIYSIYFISPFFSYLLIFYELGYNYIPNIPNILDIPTIPNRYQSYY